MKYPDLFPDQHGPSRLEHIEPTAQHLEQVALDDRRMRRGQGRDGERGLGRAAHRIDVAERVGGRNPSEKVRVVDHGAEKIGGAPGNAISAASSGLSSPIITAPLTAGCSLSMTRPSTAAGTLAAQPPQRIGSAPGSGSISGNSV